MNSLIKTCHQFKAIIDRFIRYHEFYISRAIRSITEQSCGFCLKPNSFNEAIFVMSEIAQGTGDLRNLMDKAKDSQDFASSVHFTVGQAIRNEWKLWVNSNDNKLLNDIKDRFNLFHADDMSSLILQVSWQEYKGMPIAPYTIAYGSILYWADMKKKGEWDGQADGKMVSFKVNSKFHHEMRLEELKINAYIKFLKAKNELISESTK